MRIANARVRGLGMEIADPVMIIEEKKLQLYMYIPVPVVSWRRHRRNVIRVRFDCPSCCHSRMSVLVVYILVIAKWMFGSSL